MTNEVNIGLLPPTTGVDSAQATDATKGLELYLKQNLSLARPWPLFPLAPFSLSTLAPFSLFFP